eukprot:TRINITY_DN4945_c0_g1_i1.p1 TRINITY_DN4945_c0_g1~~TRINITY_DN4945_c0_g1_i1.p1  ORF type:complete len:182 (-),score=21.74 TRINITY_DN4945_c0_g1_i1:110-655(-)
MRFVTSFLESIQKAEERLSPSWTALAPAPAPNDLESVSQELQAFFHLYSKNFPAGEDFESYPPLQSQIKLSKKNQPSLFLWPGGHRLEDGHLHLFPHDDENTVMAGHWKYAPSKGQPQKRWYFLVRCHGGEYQLIPLNGPANKTDTKELPELVAPDIEFLGPLFGLCAPLSRLQCKAVGTE